MNIKQKAKEYAISKFKKSSRKNAEEERKIIHFIDVANILTKYGFDENLIAAGYLHEVIQEQKCSTEEIASEFNEDIACLVSNITIKEKNLKWQTTKERYIKQIPNLDLRCKILICADGISRLEEIKIKSRIKGEGDSSAFRIGKELEFWYCQETYNALINNEDKDFPIFKEFKNFINEIFYIKNTPELQEAAKYIFSSDLENLVKLHYKKLEIVKLKTIIEYPINPFIIEIDGTHNSGKSSAIFAIKNFFEKKNIKVVILNDFITEDYDVKNVLNLFKEKHAQLKEIINNNLSSIIIIEHGFTDVLIKLRMMLDNNEISKEYYNNVYNLYKSFILKNINEVLLTIITPELSIRRDYIENLFLEIREKNDIEDIISYNNSLYDVAFSLRNKNYHCLAIDVTSWNKKMLQIDILDMLLDNYRDFIASIIREDLNKKNTDNT